ncbi:phosphatidylinositol 4-phosphate 5-kinase 1-like [Iris pallida]|uniref:Phosphatidylinositol 4-phosphate 5-kinase 1-like n=1 Tax=Iris pallida TaxID=29817 RepID=A0AAX6I5J4_IRIPA|nr:phosphatidylinositol 4-phosphate 5-kinase 1-like [Iris pallida]
MNHDDIERFHEKVLSNGDVYAGNFVGRLPCGTGKYIWVDETVYEGEWDKGKMTGRGRICWPSGAIYEGELEGGFLHGSGTFFGLDGSVYEGTWRMNIKHGLGTKTYSNSDIYEGFWKEGKEEGIGKFTWSNGHTYIGNWKNGKMSGRGIMKWTNGDLFDGFWLNGLEHGPGYYKSADGTYFFGTWNKGLKDGRGNFYPPGSKLPCQLKGCDSIVYDFGSESLSSVLMHSEELGYGRSSSKRNLFDKWKISNFLRHSRQVSHRLTSLDEVLGHGDATKSIPLRDSSLTSPCSSDDNQSENVMVYEREYIQGVLVMEIVRSHGSGISTNGKWHHEVPRKPAKGPGKTIYRGHKSYYLMLNLQLGIRYTVGKITPVHTREVRSSDFGPRARIKMYFPSKGSQFTPPHYSMDFFLEGLLSNGV